MFFHSFASSKPIAALKLPLTLISFEDWELITVVGEDSEKYLQGQLTIDVNLITKYSHSLTAHCNYKGKMLSNMHVFRCRDGFALIERRSLNEIQLISLKKHAIFSKVTISVNNERFLLGVAGFNARMALKNMFSILPHANASLINNGSTSLLWFEYPIERFLLVTDFKTADWIIENLHDKAQMNNSQQWLSLDIEAGEPVIDLINSGKFLPQETNLQILGGISFNKGCYIGQETITRMKFRGTNKRSLWYLSGYANRVPEPGENLELKVDKSWRNTGTVLAAVRLNDDSLLVQAVINKDIEKDSIFRVCKDTGTLISKPLPYFTH